MPTSTKLLFVGIGFELTKLFVGTGFECTLLFVGTGFEMVLLSGSGSPHAPMAILDASRPAVARLLLTLNTSFFFAMARSLPEPCCPARLIFVG